MFVSIKDGHAPVVRRNHHHLLAALIVAVLLVFAVGVAGCGGGDSSDQSIMIFGTAYAANESMDPNMDQFGFTTDDNVYEKLVDYKRPDWLAILHSWPKVGRCPRTG